MPALHFHQDELYFLIYHIADQYNLVFLETTRMLHVFIFLREGHI